MKQRSNIFLLLNGPTFNILEFIYNSKKPIQFKELKFISNPKTNKKYSTSTISEKLKKLENENLIKKIIIPKKGPSRIGYISTEKTKKVFEILSEAETKYNNLNKEQI